MMTHLPIIIPRVTTFVTKFFFVELWTTGPRGNVHEQGAFGDGRGPLGMFLYCFSKAFDKFLKGSEGLRVGTD